MAHLNVQAYIAQLLRLSYESIAVCCLKAQRVAQERRFKIATSAPDYNDERQACVHFRLSVLRSIYTRPLIRMHRSVLLVGLIGMRMGASLSSQTSAPGYSL